MAQVMDHHPLSRAQRERLGLIQSSAGSLLDIINDVLDISKIESGRMETYVEPFDAREFASGIERIYAPLARVVKSLGCRRCCTAMRCAYARFSPTWSPTPSSSPSTAKWWSTSDVRPLAAPAHPTP